MALPYSVTAECAGMVTLRGLPEDASPALWRHTSKNDNERYGFLPFVIKR